MSQTQILMPSPDLNQQLRAKIARNPLKFGLIFGFLGLPFAWALQNAILSQFFEFWPTKTMTDYFASAAVFGAILGGCALQAVANWRAGNLSAARWILMSCGVSGAIVWVWAQKQPALSFAFIEINGQEIPLSDWQVALALSLTQFQLPFYLALTMILAGIFLRPARPN